MASSTSPGWSRPSAGPRGTTSWTTSSPVPLGKRRRTPASVSALSPSLRSSSKACCRNTTWSVPRGTGLPARTCSRTRTTRSRGRKKLEEALRLPPAFSARARPLMSTTGEPDEPPEVLDAAW